MDEKMNEMPRCDDSEARLFNSLTEDELNELGDVLLISLEYESMMLKGN